MPAAGVVITTGFVHVLGDAAAILADPCLGLSGEYPWAFVFATAATLVTFCLEYFLQRFFRHRLGLPQLAGGECRHQHLECHHLGIARASLWKPNVMHE